MKQIILASQSPRRKQLMELAGHQTRVMVAPVEEIYPDELPKKEVAAYLANIKAKAVWEQLTDMEQLDNVVIASDTIVYLDNVIYGKPVDRTAAIDYLTALSGKTHYVITGVSILAKDTNINFDDTVAVTFKSLTQEEIYYYVDNYKPFDKAGAYAIQEWIGAIGITNISGDYYSVMGLPINRVHKIVQKLLLQ